MTETAPALSTPTRDIGLLDTAKLIRRHLAAAFPGIKFSVRTSRFSGGSAADVAWTDGPTDRQVSAVVKPFAYGSFDGTTDSSYCKGSWLCDEHGASFRHNSGGVGTVDGAVGGPCCLGAEPVEFGAKYVGTRRDHSPEFDQLLRDDFEGATGEGYTDNGRFAATILEDGRLVRCGGTWEYGSTLLGRLAASTAVTAEREIVRVAS